MKILFVGDYNSYVSAPAPTKVGMNLFNFAVKEGIDSFYVTYFDDGNKYSRFEKFFGETKLDSNVFRLGLLKLFIKLIKEKPTHIIAVTPAAFYLPILLFKKIFHFHFVNYMHSINAYVLRNYNSYKIYLKFRFLLIEWFCVKLADKILLLSNREKKYLLNYYTIDNSIINLVDNGTTLYNISKMSYELSDPIKIFLIGALNRPEKNFSAIFSALKEINKKFLVTICSEKKENLPNVVCPENVQINFLHSLKEKELRIELTKQDMFILPATYESFSLSLLEAISVGLPFIVSDRVGLTERFADDYLIKQLFPINNREALRQKIIDILDMDVIKRKELGRKEIEFSTRFTWDKVLKDTFYKLKNIG